jgi:1,4-alpha-glucan branching enzyme
MGCEFAQPAEWSQAHGLDWWILDQPSHQAALRHLTALNRVYRQTPALWQRDNDPGGFQWIVGDDAEANVFAWARYDDAGQPLVSVTNFSPVVRQDYSLGLPRPGLWREVLNTDAVDFGGSGVGNLGSVVAEPHESHGMPNQCRLTLPPLATVWLQPD